ncbi:MAG: hypothetical protein ACT4QD_15520 [Acidobacteriota bacterium]
MARVVLAAIWIAAAGAVGGLVYLGFTLTRGGPVVAQPIAIERLPPKQNHNPWARWSITEHLSAHHVLIAHVETDYLEEAVAIAQQIADPVKSRYAEALIYFHRPGRPDTLPPRRVQWTPREGYVETVYEVHGAPSGKR